LTKTDPDIPRHLAVISHFAKLLRTTWIGWGSEIASVKKFGLWQRLGVLSHLKVAYSCCGPDGSFCRNFL